MHAQLDNIEKGLPANYDKSCDLTGIYDFTEMKFKLEKSHDH